MATPPTPAQCERGAPVDPPKCPPTTQQHDLELSMTRAKLKYLLIINIAMSLVIIYHVQKKMLRERLETMVIYDSPEDLGVRDPDVQCHFPLFHPFDESILSYVEVANPIVCFSRQEKWTYINRQGRLVYNDTLLSKYGYSPRNPRLSCFFSEIKRKPMDDFEVIFTKERRMSGNDSLTSDFVYVHCDNFLGFPYYKNFHAHAQRRAHIRRLKSEKEMSMIVIGLDSMSRLNFMRQLPRTYQALTKLMNGTVLFGFNKVGENTFPNVIPILTGQHPMKPPYGHFEGWPLIWRNFSERGAATLYAEDLPSITMFNYHGAGLLESPTLHYMRTFWLAVENSVVSALSSALCLGPTPKHTVYFDYIKSFLRAYQDSPAFLFSLLNEPSHDYVNTVGAIDKDLEEFFVSSYHEGLFNNVVLIVLGDHGNRIDRIRGTEVGQIEDFMPMVTVVLPPSIDKRHREWRPNLEKNKNRLTSSFDLFMTFKEVLETLEGKKGSSGDEGVEPQVISHFSRPTRGMSLLGEIPKERSCSDAGIPDWFCLCQNGAEEVEREGSESLSAAAAVIRYFNEEVLKGLPQCSRQSLVSVERVASRRKGSGGVKAMDLTLSTGPGSGLFDVHLLHLPNGSYEISNVIRINRYGTQADCLPDSILKGRTLLRGVCYCL